MKTAALANAMSEEKYTRCPVCRTVFRATSSQLSMRAGQVRCGHCQTVFDGTANLVALAPLPDDDEDNERYGEAAPGSPAPSLRDSQTLDPPPVAATGIAPEVDRTQIAPKVGSNAIASRVGSNEIASEVGSNEIVSEVGSNEIPSETGQDLPAPEPRDERRRRWNIAFAVAIPVLLVLFAGQAVFHFRDAIASRWPAAGPALTQMCAAAGCALRPLHEIGYLSIDASDLQADPAHKGLLILTATVRNRAPYALSYPYLELTLTDSQDQVVVRRALAPKEYAGGTADLQSGIVPNAELAIKLFIDASASTQVGYRVYLFYP